MRKDLQKLLGKKNAQNKIQPESTTPAFEHEEREHDEGISQEENVHELELPEKIEHFEDKTKPVTVPNKKDVAQNNEASTFPDRYRNRRVLCQD